MKTNTSAWPPPTKPRQTFFPSVLHERARMACLPLAPFWLIEKQMFIARFLPPPFFGTRENFHERNSSKRKEKSFYRGLSRGPCGGSDTASNTFLDFDRTFICLMGVCISHFEGSQRSVFFIIFFAVALFISTSDVCV